MKVNISKYMWWNHLFLYANWIESQEGYQYQHSGDLMSYCLLPNILDNELDTNIMWLLVLRVKW